MRMWVRRWWLLVAVLPGALFMLVLQWMSSSNPWGVRRFTLFDDAMISMAYGRTLARTGTLTWFPGAPHVEGFTNPLWTLWMAGVHALGFDGSSAALVVSLSAGSCLIVAAVVVGWVVSVLGSFRSAVAAAVLVPFCFPTLYWSLRGMEVGVIALCAVLLCCALVVIVDGGTTSGVTTVMCGSIVIGTWTRFDFVVIAAAALVPGWFLLRSRRGRRVVVLGGVTLLLSAGSVLLWQKAYFGDWLPNTYVLKMSGVGLWDRVSRGLASSGRSVVVIGPLLVASMMGRRMQTANAALTWIGTSMCAAMICYSVYVGGDAWENVMLNRFVASVLPVGIMVVCLAFDPGGSRSSLPRINSLAFIFMLGAAASAVTVNPFGYDREVAVAQIVTTGLIVVAVWIGRNRAHRVSDGMWAAQVALSVVVLVSFVPLVRQVASDNILMTRTNLYVTETIESLRTAVDAGATVATVWAGVPAYYLGTPMIDLLGKNDRRVARSRPQASFFPGHNKWDYDYSVGLLRPDVVFQVFARGNEAPINTRLRGWGYSKRCIPDRVFPSDGVWVNSTSTMVDQTILVACDS